MKTLLKIIREVDGVKVVDLKTVPTKSVDIFYENILPIQYAWLPVQPASIHQVRGELTLKYTFDPDLIQYLITVFFVDTSSRPYSLMPPCAIEIYTDIDEFDPDDIELAINVRAVHKSPDPDFNFKHCMPASCNFEEQYDVCTDSKRLLLTNIKFAFNG